MVQLAVKPTQSEYKTKRGSATLALPGIRDLVVDGTAKSLALAAFIGRLEHLPAPRWSAA